MSNWREQLSEEAEARPMLTWVQDYYHVPFLVVLLGFVLWNRIRNYDNFIVDGTVYLSGNDPWYHLRMTEYTVENFPRTMPFDPMTYFPIGTDTGQFGTIFDQIIALVALIVGLGDPSESLVRELFLIAPPFFALLACIPGYYIGKRLGGRVGGLVAVGVIAFVPDRFMFVTIAGVTQHEALEVVFMGVSILGLMAALSYARKEKPAYELLLAREFDAMRGTIGYSMLAGVAMAMYVWTWPPAVWIFAVVSIFFVLNMSLDHLSNRSPEHDAFVGVLSMATAGVLVLSTTRSLEIAGTVTRSLLQPGLAFAGASGVLFLAWLSREFHARELPKYTYPATIVASLVAVALVMSFALPNLFDFLLKNVDRVFGFVTSPGSTVGTIGEGRPMEFSELTDTYVYGMFTAGLGAAAILIRQALDEERRSEELLVVVWGVMMLIATLTQIRFAYYMTLVVGALNAAFIGYSFRLMGSPDREFQFETYQLLVVGVVVLVMFAPLLGAPLIAADTTATEFSDGVSLPRDVVAWDDSLQYVNENTPEPGQYGSPDNEPMALFGDYEETDDFEYPDGSYGVMSWWDYGHWITQRAERIPNANPFQQGASDAASFLLAQDEQEAMGALAEVDENENAQTQYVMIDWRMVQTEGRVGGKFFAPPNFVPEYDVTDFSTQLMNVGERGRLRSLARIQKQPYYDSMVTRLYHYHGSAQEPSPIVVEWTGQEREFPQEDVDGTYIESNPAGQNTVQVFDNMRAAQQYVEENPSTQIGGIGAMPSERVEGLSHFRLVHMANTSAIPRTPTDRQMAQYGVNLGMQNVALQTIRNTGFAQALAGGNASGQEAQRQARIQALNMMYPTTTAFTKTFERVPGATIQGTGPENEILSVSVTLAPENGQEFNYERRVETDDEGAFELVVPYATTGYDEYGVEEGYTDSAVEATTDYRISTAAPQQNDEGNFVVWETNLNVTEAQVLGEDPEPVSVELEKRVIEVQNDSGEDGEGSSDDEQSDGGNDGDESTSSDDGNTSSGDGSSEDRLTIGEIDSWSTDGATSTGLSTTVVRPIG